MTLAIIVFAPNLIVFFLSLYCLADSTVEAGWIVGGMAWRYKHK